MIGDEAVLTTLSKTLIDKRVSELQDENKKLRDTLHFIQQAYKEKCGHVNHLVWYARSSPEEKRDKARRTAIKKAYPAEVKKLKGQSGMWQHGFDCGCLAVCNMVNSIIHAETLVKEINQDHEECKSAPLTLQTCHAIILSGFPNIRTNDEE